MGEREPERNGFGPWIDDIERALLALDRPKTRRLLREACGRCSPLECLEEIVAPALRRIGDAWERGQVALAQVYMSGRICEELSAELLPATTDNHPRVRPKMAIAVLEDHHALGKRIVLTMLRAAGFAVSDFGHGLGAAALVERVREEEVEVLMISTLMLRSALLVESVTSALGRRGDGVRGAVGGAPFLLDPALGREVGADAVGGNAAQALGIARSWAGRVR